MGILFIIIVIVSVVLIYINATVASANKSFHKKLIDKGYSHREAKRIMDQENDNYNTFVSTTGGGGMMLRHWLENAINNY